MVRRFFTLVCMLLGAFMFSQAASFVAHYAVTTNLALSEIEVVVRDFEAASSEIGLTSDQALAQYASTENAFLRDRGARLSEVIHRYEHLQRSAEQLSQPISLGGLLAIAANMDLDVLSRTGRTFQPGLPTSAFAFGLAFLGLLFGLVFARICGRTLSFIYRSLFGSPRARRSLPSTS
ncbi:MAG: DUF2937 family protein [Pseudomonadota bacterium]